MSWKLVERGDELDLVGPVGDTITINITSTDTDYGAWTGWTWTGEIKQDPTSAANVATFAITDTSTSGTLTLVAEVADTSAFRAGDNLVWGIRGVKSGRSYTHWRGLVKPQPQLVD